jgi:sugar phosphate isomerase/epimerase
LCGDVGGFTDPPTVDERITRTKQMFELCVDLRTPILTTHIGVVPDDPAGRGYSDLLGAVREVAEYAANRGCCLAIETGPESPESLAEFLSRVDSGGARVNYDPANLVMNGFNPLDGLYTLRDYIVHTHAKDGVARAGVDDAEVREVPVGEGDVDFPRYLHILRDELGYSGYLTIERECGSNPVADLAAAVAYLKRQPGVAS